MMLHNKRTHSTRPHTRNTIIKILSLGPSQSKAVSSLVGSDNLGTPKGHSTPRLCHRSSFHCTFTSDKIIANLKMIFLASSGRQFLSVTKEDSYYQPCNRLKRVQLRLKPNRIFPTQESSHTSTLSDGVRTRYDCRSQLAPPLPPSMNHRRATGAHFFRLPNRLKQSYSNISYSCRNRSWYL
jgi:hypothetical protein